jgi:ribosomal protein S18 acetylase RimI-like enzyme
MTGHPLDNAIWTALTTRQRHLAIGGARARRYPAELAKMAAVSEYTPEAFTELAALIPLGELVLLSAMGVEHVGPVLPPNLHIVGQAVVVQMVCADEQHLALPYDDVVSLGEADRSAMQALVALTNPGPYEPRTADLGTFLGIRHMDRLVAMGGERFYLDGYREISAVCTHPDVQGRGYASQLVSRLVRNALERRETAFLHVEHTNQRAQRVYQGLGFVERAHVPVIAVYRSA